MERLSYSRPAGSPLVTWTQFSEAYVGKYMPLSMRKRLQDEFSDLREGPMYMAEYEVRFHELARHTSMILPRSMSKFDALSMD